MSSKQGKALESYLATLHANYRRQKLGHIFKVPTPLCITGNIKGKITGHLESPVFVDFTGLLAGGVAVALEAKYTQHEGPSYPLGKIRPGQRDVLSSVHELGGVSAVFVRRYVYHATRPSEAGDYLIPASYIDGLDRKSWRWDEVVKYRIPAGKTWVDALNKDRMGHGDWSLYCHYGWSWRDARYTG